MKNIRVISGIIVLSGFDFTIFTASAIITSMIKCLAKLHTDVTLDDVASGGCGSEYHPEVADANSIRRVLTQVPSGGC